MTTKPHNHSESGLTTVELVVTLVIGVLFVAAGYQLFMAVTLDSSASRDQSLASNIASAELSRQVATSTACTTTPQSPIDLPAPADTPLIDPEVTSQVSWPYGCNDPINVKRVEVSVTYGDPDSRQEVRHARLTEG